MLEACIVLQKRIVKIHLIFYIIFYNIIQIKKWTRCTSLLNGLKDNKLEPKVLFKKDIILSFINNRINNLIENGTDCNSNKFLTRQVQILKNDNKIDKNGRYFKRLRNVSYYTLSGEDGDIFDCKGKNNDLKSELPSKINENIKKMMSDTMINSENNYEADSANDGVEKNQRRYLVSKGLLKEIKSYYTDRRNMISKGYFYDDNINKNNDGRVDSHDALSSERSQIKSSKNTEKKFDYDEKFEGDIKDLSGNNKFYKREVIAISKNLKLSFIKTLRVVNEIMKRKSNRSVYQALSILLFSPRRPSLEVFKCIKSCLYNAKFKYGEDIAPRIKEILVLRGSYSKKVVYRAKGKTDIQRKPRTHIRVVMNV